MKLYDKVGFWLLVAFCAGTACAHAVFAGFAVLAMGAGYADGRINGWSAACALAAALSGLSAAWGLSRSKSWTSRAALAGFLFALALATILFAARLGSAAGTPDDLGVILFAYFLAALYGRAWLHARRPAPKLI